MQVYGGKQYKQKKSEKRNRTYGAVKKGRPCLKVLCLQLSVSLIFFLSSFFSFLLHVGFWGQCMGCVPAHGYLYHKVMVNSTAGGTEYVL